MYITYENELVLGTSAVVQWLGLWGSIAGGVGSIPGWGTKILQATQPKIKLNELVLNFLKIADER